MPPRIFSHYTILRRLGSGGMGEVYLARDDRQQRPVALKVMSAELAKDPNQCKRFHMEAKVALGLSHPNLCTVFEAAEIAGGRPYLAMEYIEGQTLAGVLMERRLAPSEVVSLAISVAEALHVAHERGLVHRDIKPANLMFDARGQVKVMDFGLAKSFAPGAIGLAAVSAAHTQTGLVIGTPYYMSPEQASGGPLDPRTDIFSLGVVLYELVAGQRPFLGRTPDDVLANIIQCAPPPLSLAGTTLPAGLEGIILRCLEKDRENRYPSARELAAALRQLQAGTPMMSAASSSCRGHAAEPRPTALWRLAGTVRGDQRRALRRTVWVAVFVLAALACWWLFGLRQ
jgi:serine/threonine-protein kinase